MIEPRKCNVADCDRSPTRRGMCKKHYERWRVHGDPSIVLRPFGRGLPRPARSPEHCAKISAARRQFFASAAGEDLKRRLSEMYKGSGHPQWKAEVGYKAAHYRVYSARGRPEVCEHCGASGPGAHMEWANVSGNYLDVDDYISLCKSCHNRFDGVAANLGAAS